MAVIDWWNGPLTLVVIFFALCLLLLTWSIACIACRACHSSGTLFSLWHTHTNTHTHTPVHTYTQDFTNSTLKIEPSKKVLNRIKSNSTLRSTAYTKKHEFFFWTFSVFSLSRSTLPGRIKRLHDVQTTQISKKWNGHNVAIARPSWFTGKDRPRTTQSSEQNCKWD